jgi:1,4-alpha-glucan branching enzyme
VFFVFYFSFFILNKMNRIRLTLIALFFISFQTFGQITLSPALPTDADSLTITFDASQGSAGLKDFTGNIYAHTGVITDKSTSTSDWKYVVADWTVNVSKAKLTRISSNIYTLKISPDIRQFYGVPQGEKILKLAIVFRSEDCSKEGKTASGSDIFADVYESGLSISISTPSTSPLVIDAATTIPVIASGNECTKISLLLNNKEITSVNAAELNYTIPAQVAGKYIVKAIGYNATSQVEDSVIVIVRSEVENLARPEGSRVGISYPTDNSARLVLFAPQKQFVYVIGDFNAWTPDNAWLMKKDGDYFWIDIPNLISGQQYLFQYIIDGTVTVADPYTSVVADPWNDKYLSSDVYSNLPVYPTGKTSGIASVLLPGASVYSWKTTQYTAPDKNKLIIYELHVRDFTEEGTIKAASAKLDYLQSLGINAVELMPVNEFEGNDSWGYNPSFYFAFDKAYGKADDYKAFIDECHSRGIAVIQDLVLNHSYGQSPFLLMYFDGSKPTSDNPWYNVTSNFQNPDAQWGYDFNHNSVYTRALVDSVAAYWMGQFKVDGFRYDFTKGFSNTPYGTSSWGSDYDASRISNLERMASEVWKRKPEAYVIFEHLSDNPEEKILSDTGIMLWGNMNWAYSQSLEGYSSGADVSRTYYRQRGWEKPGLVGYMESHDEERTMYRAINYGVTSGSYNVKSLATAVQRAKALNSIFLMYPGPKMIWQFGELGYDVTIDYNGRTGRKPVKWNYFEDATRNDIYYHIAMLNYLRSQSDAFATGAITGNQTGLVKTLVLTHSDLEAVVMSNFDVSDQIATVTFSKTGTWYDYLNQKNVDISTQTTTFTLQPGETRIYLSKAIVYPDFGVAVTYNTQNNSALNVYPNPAANTINLATDCTLAQVAIYNSLGKCVMLKNGNRQCIDIQSLPNGYYLVKAVSRNGSVLTSKFIKI